MKLFASLLLLSMACYGHCYKFSLKKPVYKFSLAAQPVVEARPVVAVENPDIESEILTLQKDPTLLELAPPQETEEYSLSGSLEENLGANADQYLDAEDEVTALLKTELADVYPKSITKALRPGIVGDCPRNSEWTPWHNRDRPSGTGDWEVKSLYLPRGTCAEENASGIEARIVSTQLPYYTGGNIVSISPTYGFSCQRKRQRKGRPCKDYEIRFCCKPEDYNDGIVGSCPSKDGEWTPWDNRDRPGGDGDWELRSLYRPERTCADDEAAPLAIQARLFTSKQPYQFGGDSVSINPSLGFVCRNHLQSDKRCNDYEVRYCCKKKNYNNGVVGTCPRGGVWTSWHNRDHPSGTGDWEIRSLYSPRGTCVDDSKTPPLAIQARLFDGKLPYQNGGDVVTINPDLGFICKNNNQGDGRCDNYEVRYCCPPKVQGVVGYCDPEKDEWTPWDSRDRPSGSGDWETRSDYRHRGTCASEAAAPKAIQARLVRTKQPYSISGETVSISPGSGFVCKNRDQGDKYCDDYEVRYCCPRKIIG